MEIVSVSMTELLLDRIDGFADEHGYAGRSEVIREASRSLLSEFDDDHLEDISAFVRQIRAVDETLTVEFPMISWIAIMIEDILTIHVQTHR